MKTYYIQDSLVIGGISADNIEKFEQDLHSLIVELVNIYGGNVAGVIGLMEVK